MYPKGSLIAIPLSRLKASMNCLQVLDCLFLCDSSYKFGLVRLIWTYLCYTNLVVLKTCLMV